MNSDVDTKVGILVKKYYLPCLLFKLMLRLLLTIQHVQGNIFSINNEIGYTVSVKYLPNWSYIYIYLSRANTRIFFFGNFCYLRKTSCPANI